MAEQRGAFADHDAVLGAVKRMKVHELKETLKGLNDLNDGVARWQITGLKKDFIERIHSHFGQLKEKGDEAAYKRAKSRLEQYYGSHITQAHGAGRSSYSTWQAPPQALGHEPAPVYGAPPGAYHYPGQYGNGAGPSSMGVYGAPAVPQQRWPTFKESPFYKVTHWIAQETITPHMRDPNAKLETTINVQLSDEQKRIIRESSSTQLRLFCAPQAAFFASADARHPTIVEFPIITDVRVNGANLTVNLRGKKTPAKVPPPNLNKDGRLALGSGYVNRVSVYCSQVYSKYQLAVALCECSTAESLAEDVRKNKIKSKDDVIRDMRRAAEDDDIEIGDVGIGLKCPLSYMRLQIPARSKVCEHTQCFDALSFFSVNEQSPSWQCPTCQKSVDPGSIFLDGYMLDILKRVPDDVETVTIDNEGRWRTADGKYRSDNATTNGSANVSASLAQSAGTSAAPTPSQEANGVPRVKGEDEGLPSSSRATPQVGGGGREKQIEVLELDSDDDEEGTPPPPRGTVAQAPAVAATAPNGLQARSSEPAAAAASSTSTFNTAPESTGARGVIDLTLSDSEDEADAPPPRRPAPQVLAPLPSPPRYRAPVVGSHRPINGAPNGAWDLIDRLGANGGHRQPIFGGTFQQHPPNHLPPPHFQASHAMPSPSISSPGQHYMPPMSAAPHSSTPGAGPSGLPMLEGDFRSTSVPAPPSHANGLSLAERLGRQIAAAPHASASPSGSNGAGRSAPPEEQHEDSEAGDESLPISRHRKRPRRNSRLGGDDEVSSNGNGAALPEELRGIDFDDFELEMDANAGLGDEGHGNSSAGHSSLEGRLSSATVQSGTSKTVSSTAATQPANGEDAESSDGLQEDERAGLSTRLS